MKVLYNFTALLGNKVKLISDTIPISAAMHTVCSIQYAAYFCLNASH